MIVGVGIDIIEVDRVAEKTGKENGFREKVFSAREIVLCEAQANKAQHYAGRFASKEAFLKATGKGLTLGLDLKDIEVIQDELGKPFIELHGNFREEALRNQWNKIHLSISHVQAMACAVVILES
jgi:holo-[acyl-carrier protein] synthase